MIHYQKYAPGRVFLIIAGIIMIIFGVSAIGVLVGGILGLIGLTDFPEQNSMRLSFLMLGLGLVGVIQLVTGIIGIKNCNMPEKAKVCFVWGILAAASALIGIILSVVMEPNWDAVMDVYGIYVCLSVLPTLYLIGAVRNRRGY